MKKIIFILLLLVSINSYASCASAMQSGASGTQVAAECALESHNKKVENDINKIYYIMLFLFTLAGVVIAKKIKKDKATKEAQQLEQIDLLKKMAGKDDVLQFAGERLLSNDAYKIYLTKKYVIEKNEALGKFICADSLFSTIDEALAFANEKELDGKAKPASPAQYRQSEAELDTVTEAVVIKAVPTSHKEDISANPQVALKRNVKSKSLLYGAIVLVLIGIVSALIFFKNKETKTEYGSNTQQITSIVESENFGKVIDGKFIGAWFTINAPAGFTVKPSLKSSTSNNLNSFDSAFFISPDSEVEFYVFSPQWMGRPTDFECNPIIEGVVTSEKKGDEKKSFEYFNCAAKDNSYIKSMVLITENERLNYAFGIKYKNQAAYEKYKAEYLSFKKSLTQFSDG